MSNLSQVITQLEFAWQDIQYEHPELPDVIVTSSRRRHKSEASTNGQHCTNVWKVPKSDDLLAEVTIFGELMMQGSQRVMQTLLHEAAHAIAHKREIRDTSNRGRFHNKKFASIAEELGLQPPAESGGSALGYSDCTITEETTIKYKDTISKLDSVLKLYIPPEPDDEDPEPKKPVQKAACECPNEKDDHDQPYNTITWAKWMQKKFDAYNVPPLICGVCRQAFMPLEEDA
jgi:hypothetical protein